MCVSVCVFVWYSRKLLGGSSSRRCVRLCVLDVPRARRLLYLSIFYLRGCCRKSSLDCTHPLVISQSINQNGPRANARHNDTTAQRNIQRCKRRRGHMHATNRNDIQRNDVQHNDIQRNDKALDDETRHNDIRARRTTMYNTTTQRYAKHIGQQTQK